ncbi:MAG: AAA family ATPase, partial [Caldilineaceae bacterium]|nr:AAA family ATPase [Caldilineaceae bacterium]
EPLTSFIGRQTELAAITALVQNTRLVTLTGPGGVGKTRLALAVRVQVTPHFPDGVFAVALASLQHPDYIWHAVAAAAGIKEQERHAVQERVMDFFAGKSVLLLLDNFEHLLAAAPQVTALLDRAPRLHVLVTSRAPLQVHGEQEYPVAPLMLPTDTGQDRPEETEAVHFFVDRVRLAMPGFRITPANAHAVAQLCVALDGLPLALELA